MQEFGWHFGSVRHSEGAERPWESLFEIATAANKGGPAKANGLCGERRSQGTGGIFRLREMEHCGLCFDEGGGPPKVARRGCRSFRKPLSQPIRLTAPLVGEPTAQVSR